MKYSNFLEVFSMRVSFDVGAEMLSVSMRGVSKLARIAVECVAFRFWVGRLGLDACSDSQLVGSMS